MSLWWFDSKRREPFLRHSKTNQRQRNRGEENNRKKQQGGSGAYQNK